MNGKGFIPATVMVCAGLSHGIAAAQSLPDGAIVTFQQTVADGQSRIALGPWRADTGLPFDLVQGTVTTESWQVPDPSISTQQLLARLQSQIQADGFDAIFSCAAADCGGFDFRFAIPILPEPQMHVDLGDFRYLSARKPGNEGPEFLLLLISRGPGLVYVQRTRILPPSQKDSTAKAPPQDPAAGAEATPQTAAVTGPGLTAQSVVADLLKNGAVALDDLVFAPGAARLVAGDYASLKDLGEWLLANPSITIAFVGHTDATGGLDGNIALSKRRAESVRAFLLDLFKLPAGQVAAEGMGYLAPRAPNDTPEGQAKNRRVEVIVTSTP